ncbi:chemotaxis protein CheA [Aliikangiella marina]|uniref:Chemotaxis protein CheA n=1 Tax=Aliikangiella marina TaxID=1712262 RepID=A0A545T4Z1_9GAMM|nr:chemotaxis protein CheA [Aliikangiella marina]TQV72301.1 chemotaxis protein CheA [Aliikangiella marina]
MDLSDFLPAFISESEDNLQIFEDSLVEMSNGSRDDELINTSFRAIHSIKGGAGMFDAQPLVDLVHIAESVLDLARKGTVEITDELLDTFFDAKDFTEQYLQQLNTGAVEPIAAAAPIIDILQAYLDGGAIPTSSETETAASSQTNDFDTAQSSDTSVSNTSVSDDANTLLMEIEKEALHFGFRMEPLLKEIEDTKTINSIHLDYSGPKFEHFNPLEMDLSVSVSASPGFTEEDVEELLSFSAGVEGKIISSAENDGKAPGQSNDLLMEIEKEALNFGFRMEPLLKEIEESKTIRAIELEYFGPEFSKLNPLQLNLAVTVSASPKFTEDDVEELLSFSAGVEGKIIASDAAVLNENPALSEPTSNQPIPNAVTESPANQSATTAKKKPAEVGQLIKVNSLKLDQLVDDVGELISQKVQLNAALEHNSWEEMAQAVKELTKGLNDLRDTALALRLVPLGNTLSRFHRVVREAARTTGKQIEMDIIGGHTELDRVTVEKIVDPLTHIIRNSCDHGIEAPQDRIAAGKPEKGKITISAQYLGSGVSLKVRDDGKGLNKEKILEKALSRGLVRATDELSDRAIFQLIFHAGLSTAEKVTDLSGRGVGMDVVRKNINQIGGEVIIDSKEGQGTTLDIRLPLTTAILNGFSFRMGDATLIVQMDQVLECIRKDEFSNALVQDQDCLLLRGEYIPLIRIDKQLHLNSRTQEHEALIVFSQHGPIALLADQLQGEIETVVKPLDPILKQSNHFSGIIKLSSGDLGFVLDIHQLLMRSANFKSESNSEL